MTTAADIFTDLNNRITPEKASKINATYLFDIGGDDGGKWLVDLTGDGNWVTDGSADPDANCTVSVKNAEDWVGIATGKINPTMAFMQGKIKVKGDMSLAMKLQALLA